MLRQRFSSLINNKIFYAKDRRNFLATKLRVTGTKTSRTQTLSEKPHSWDRARHTQFSIPRGTLSKHKAAPSANNPYSKHGMRHLLASISKQSYLIIGRGSPSKKHTTTNTRYPSQEEVMAGCKRGTPVGGGHGRLQRRHDWHEQQRRHFKEAAPHFRSQQWDTKTEAADLKQLHAITSRISV